MSSRPRLLKKQSSLAILVELERETCESASRPASETDQGREEDAEEIGEYGGEPDGIAAQEGTKTIYATKRKVVILKVAIQMRRFLVKTKQSPLPFHLFQTRNQFPRLLVETKPM